MYPYLIRRVYVSEKEGRRRRSQVFYFKQNIKVFYWPFFCIILYRRNEMYRVHLSIFKRTDVPQASCIGSHVFLTRIFPFFLIKR